ncbi:MAG TPA: hydantoinase B/oxoprolinase family protein, partial [Gemmatimonadales bacterium]
IPAAGAGTAAPLFVAWQDPESGHRRVSAAQTLSGGSGARPNKDGVEGAEFSNFTRNIPIEVLEQEAPVEILRYSLREDSAGAGTMRGGSGVEFTFRCLAPEMVLTARGLERFHFRPWGLAGGRPGTPARATLNPGTPEARDLGKVDVQPLRAGDVIQFLTPGGAGYGPPLLRDPERVAIDVRDGLVSRESARGEYGVVIDPAGHLDLEATSRLRRVMGEGRATSGGADPEVDFGPERRRYDGFRFRSVQG